MRGLQYVTKKTHKKAVKLMKLCEKQGLHIKITDTLRTRKEQDILYAQGRTQAGNIVTYAKGTDYNSMHMWGVAFDFCRMDGKGAYNNDDGFFYKVGQIGKKIGLIWGGDWTIKDNPHFQLKNWGDTPFKLKKMYDNPLKFFKTKHPKLYKTIVKEELKNEL